MTLNKQQRRLKRLKTQYKFYDIKILKKNSIKNIKKFFIEIEQDEIEIKGIYFEI